MISEHLDIDSHTLVIAFSSQPQNFEWGGTLSRIGVKHILVRDETDNWYQDGVSGIGSPRDTIKWLEWLIKTELRVIYLGLSAGSYAALLFNAFTKPQRTIAISPVTGSGMLPDFDSKWHGRLNGRPHFRAVADLAHIYFNVQHVERVTAVISDGEGTELDCQMCTRIGVNPIMIRGFSHISLAKQVATSGYLESLIK